MGGAERVLSLLSQAFMERGHAVSVVTLYGDQKDFFDLPTDIQRVTLGVTGSIQSMWRLSRLRRAILSTRPDVVISFICRMNIMTLMAMSGAGTPVIVSERTDPGAYQVSQIWKRLRGWTYPYADRIVVQSTRALEYFLPELNRNACIIPNPVIAPPVEDVQERSLLRKPMILSIGRFIQEKRFDLLIHAFSKLREKYPKWALTIFGDGPLRKDYELLQRKMGLEECLYLPGNVKHPYEMLKQADLFVLSSSVEGFPNALCEAMACGLPVISSDCPSGPREIIRNNVDGVLVPPNDVDTLSEAMDRLMSDEQERKSLASRAPEIIQRFGIEEVVNQWEALLALAVKGGRV